MRIYRNFPEAFEEIRRDLREMGVNVHTRTMQDKFIADNPDFATLELQNYSYCVTEPKYEDLKPTQPWADAEWDERESGCLGIAPDNPGEAWKLRHEVWDQFREQDGRFSYYYPERLREGAQVEYVIEALKRDNMSRQCFISIWNPELDPGRLGKRRVPCSIGYHLMFRDGGLDVSYYMRSCDFSTHYQNDIFFAMRLRDLVANHAGLPSGKFYHFINSLHVYQKDVKEVF